MSDRRLNVAIFSDSAHPILNGVSVSIDLLVGGLRAKGHSVHIFTTTFPHHRDNDPNIHRCRTIHTPWSKDYPLAFPPFYPMLREFRKQEFDVIHTHTPFMVGFVGLRWAESHEIPIVATYHTNYDKYSHYVPVFPKRYLRYKLAKHLNYYYNRVSQVITPSETSKKWLLRHSIKTPITVIPTGVPPPQLIERAESRNQLGIKSDHKVLLYAGRIAREKNLGVLLESFKLANDRTQGLQLIIVGDGPARSELAALARKLRIGDRVRFVGAVPRAEVDRYYSAADLFVFGSMTETQGLVVAEAMSYGVPVVVVQGGGASEAVIDGLNGFVAKNEAADFADLILKSLSDDDMRTKLEVGARKTAREFRVEAATDRVLDVYLLAMEAENSTYSKAFSIR